MTEDIKKEEVKEEEATETTEEVVEEVSEPSELEEAQARAEEFENKYLRAHAEMQNIQRRANEERQQLQKYRSQDLAKAILPSLDNLERALAVEGLTDDVKKGLEMVQESLVHALKEEGIEVVLVNSNPATIMTDKDIADEVYIEPLTVEALKQIILKEKPDSILPTLGGQAGLNLAMEIAETGFLEEHRSEERRVGKECRSR